MGDLMTGERRLKRNRPNPEGEIVEVDRPHVFNLPDSPLIRVQERLVDSDGNCLFRAVSRQIYGTEDYHEMIRAEAVNYIEQGRAFFQNFLPESWPFADYCNIMRMNASWGGELEIQAMSEMYRINFDIYILTPDNQRLEKDARAQAPYVVDARIRVLHEGRSHYTSLEADGGQPCVHALSSHQIFERLPHTGQTLESGQQLIAPGVIERDAVVNYESQRTEGHMTQQDAAARASWAEFQQAEQSRVAQQTNEAMELSRRLHQQQQNEEEQNAQRILEMTRQQQERQDELQLREAQAASLAAATGDDAVLAAAVLGDEEEQLRRIMEQTRPPSEEEQLRRIMEQSASDYQQRQQAEAVAASIRDAQAAQSSQPPRPPQEIDETTIQALVMSYGIEINEITFGSAMMQVRGQIRERVARGGSHPEDDEIAAMVMSMLQ